MSSIKINVKQGIVRGCEEKLPNGKVFVRFSGIRYAQPPINELRFRSPQKLIKFDQHELDCTKERDACIHKSTLTGKYVGSEDCLNLNLYVPVSDDDTEKLAVMVYIHGGSLKYDSNSKELYSPEYLLMENVIVVTINYRLHTLGFLSLPKMGISGNAGLKDQQMALEWIHENISSFNGDPNKICLFGESAGAACVHFHVLNQRSRKCIMSAICQSGSVFSDANFQDEPEKKVRILSKLLGCNSEAIEDIHNTLMAASAKDLYDNCDNVLTQMEQKIGLRNKWRMVIEDESDDAFITKNSVESLISQAGQITIPIIFGTNNGDGMPIAAKIIIRKLLDLFNRNFHFLIPRSIRVKSDYEAKEVVDLIRNFYFNGRNLSEENVTEFVKLLSDIYYLIDQTIANELHSRHHPGCKQFLNEFQFDGKLNLQKKQTKMQHIPLAAHADDLFYLFGGTLADKVILTEDSREWKMRKTMCKLWTNFAKYGDPTPNHDNPLPFKWSAVKPVANSANEIDFDYLAINDEIKLIRNLNKDRMDFWRNVYRKWNKDFTKGKL